MNYRELCQNLLDYLYQGMASWSYDLKNVEDNLTADKDQRQKKLINDLQYQVQIWVEQLDNVRYDLENSEIQSEEQDSKLLYNKLCYLIDEISSLEVIKDNQVEWENQCTQTLEDLNVQLNYEERKEESLKQLITDNEETLNGLREEKEKKENEINELQKHIVSMNAKLKKQKEEIIIELQYSKQLDEEILNKKNRLEKLKKQANSKQQKLQKIKERNTEKEQTLGEIEQKITNALNQLSDIEIEDRFKKIDSIKVELNDAIGEVEFIQSKVNSEHSKINELGSNIELLRNQVEQSKSDHTESDNGTEKLASKPLKEELDELQGNISQHECSGQEGSTQCLQDNSISSTVQEEVLSKGTQTLSTQKEYSSRVMEYIVFFTIPFALTGVSLTVIPLVKPTENNTIFLSIGLSFSTLATVCLVAAVLYNYYSKPTVNLELSEESNDNFIKNAISQAYNVSKV